MTSLQSLDNDATLLRALEYPAGEPVIFIRYRSEYDWKCGNDSLTEADFHRSIIERDALAAELTTLGHRVYGVLWESADFRRWRAGQPDSYGLRDEWAEEALLSPTLDVFTFSGGWVCASSLASGGALLKACGEAEIEFPSKKEAVQSIVDQTTGVPSWDQRNRLELLAELCIARNWIRHPYSADPGELGYRLPQEDLPKLPDTVEWIR